MGYFDSVLSIEFNLNCKWLPVNQFLFQMANIFLVFTYFIKPINAWGFIKLKLSLTLAGLCFAIWGGLIICSFDCLIWNLIFAFVNAAHILYLLVKVRSKRFSAEHEHLYVEAFRTCGVERFQYCKFSELSKNIVVQIGEYFTKDDLNQKREIYLVTSGRLEIYLGGTVVGHVSSMEFLNSPEWVNSEELKSSYQISIKAITDCQVFKWDKESLFQLFKNDAVLKNAFDALIAKDICKKLLEVYKKILILNGVELLSEDAKLHKSSIANYSTEHFENYFTSDEVHLNISEPYVKDHVKNGKKTYNDFSVIFSKDTEKSEKINLLSENFEKVSLLSEKHFDTPSQNLMLKPIERSSLIEEETHI
ncbi:popeye domain-containing protein 3 [Hydra vulgaris]|uniref:popeye domain-containing protein 3 n=1 Tax=Hydra vulgaris TaxID=6087 RepID=UPI001F5FE66A|nr:popeye domain-containing protein 3 [Hydra vulgaris]XP_047129086.1 popeye domain-containing protein 3 [Hydra vulgaris]